MTAEKNEEYRRRYNAIASNKSLTQAAGALGLKYSTLAKWYHDNRDAFSEETQEAIRGNGGRPMDISRPIEIRPLRENETPKELADATIIVDAFLLKIENLQRDKAQLELENEALRNELKALREGHSPYTGAVGRLAMTVSRAD